MDIGSIFLILGLLLLVALFIARPLLERHSVPLTRADTEHSALLAERERVLTALQELDFDYALGKIPEEDYPDQRSQLLQRGAEVLKRLDRLTTTSSSGTVEDQLEAAIAARKADHQHPVAEPQLESAAPVSSRAAAPAPAARSVSSAVARRLANGGDDELETLIANRRRIRSEKAAGFCPQCGGAVQKSDRFCPKCGASLD